MKKIIFSLGTMAAMTPITLALFSFSPATCGCTETWEELAYFANITAKDVTELSAAKLSEGINNKLSKSKHTFNHGPVSQDHGCEEINSSLIICETDTEHSYVAQRGYKFEYSRDSLGLLEKVKVEPYTKWHFPNPSFMWAG